MKNIEALQRPKYKIDFQSFFMDFYLLNNFFEQSRHIPSYP